MSVRVVLQADPEWDAGAADRLAKRLRAELTDLDVELVRPVSGGGAGPAGAKGPDPVTLGALLLVLSASGGVFTTLIGALQDWLTRQSGRHRISVTIDGDTIELERASATQQRELIEAFIKRRTDG
ncbi:hypothetical protein GCM10010156_35810 [Planobispora rosea]|uniref:Uncharacterized protein n=1 Tax=Planobispora rosea TaxID=35762 RepID=A0A8J3RY77_PLARO|nr:hypothetical protein [Planobispora rosea]GGS73739.1 hypothetical protein GCM10010156_35810 [Planobispora rosea]GIH81654.1 hypothetical protein Pro02_00620 [Planobispora rosea]